MPRRYKLGPEGEMRRAWGGKLPEEFSQRDMLAFMAETDLQLQGAVSQIDRISTIIHQIDFDIQQMKAGKSIMSYLLDIDVKLVEYPPQNILYLRRKFTQEECLNGYSQFFVSYTKR